MGIHYPEGGVPALTWTAPENVHANLEAIAIEASEPLAIASDGRFIYLSGTMKGTVAIKVGEALFTIPAALRPKTLQFINYVVKGGSISKEAKILPNGEVIPIVELTKGSAENGIFFNNVRAA
jgi:hypothetical protein